MALYRKKPVVIEAIQFDGQNYDEIIEFTEKNAYVDTENLEFMVKTLEGRHIITKGDYIIRGIVNEFYPCKPHVFVETYEKVDNVKTDLNPHDTNERAYRPYRP